MKYEVMKTEEGTIAIEGLPLRFAIHLRYRIEVHFDAQVELKVPYRGHTILLMRGANGEPLGDDEDARGMRMWLSGWEAGYREEADCLNQFGYEAED